MLYNACISGVFAAIGSSFGKLSGANYIVGDSYLIWLAILAMMVTVNTCGIRHYLRALDEAANSVTPTIVSASTSYTLTGIIGILVFRESTALRWWLGVLQIIVGVTLLVWPRRTVETVPKTLKTE